VNAATLKCHAIADPCFEPAFVRVSGHDAVGYVIGGGQCPAVPGLLLPSADNATHNSES